MEKKKKILPEVGRLRSVLQTPILKHRVKADSFFHKLHDFYLALWQNEELLLTPHYPCAIDILPSVNKEYQVILSTLPGSLKDANEIKVSLSLRLYPVGIASLRLGFFFKTDNNFKIEDIIDFLWGKKTCIEIDGEQFDIDSLSTHYADKIINELVKTKKPPLGWIDTHSIIDIVGVTKLPSSIKACKDFFSPLLNLQKKYAINDEKIENLSSKGDWLLPGKKSMVICFPFAESDCDRRKVRRWLRNFIELFSIQEFLIGQIQASKFAEIFRKNKQFWIDKLKRGVLPNDINSLFSLWLYTKLHQCPGLIGKDAWRIRYQKSLKVLDNEDRIQKANDIAMIELAKIENETSRLHSKAGNFFKSIWEKINETIKAVAELT